VKKSIGFYLQNIFFHPKAAAEAITQEFALWPVILVSALLGMIPYLLIVLLGYSYLGWDHFPYKQYYPRYFDPYWWEMLLVPVWSLVIALGFGIPSWYLSRLFGGKATFKQVLAVVMLASVVSLPIMVSVDLLLPDPESVYQFAVTGINHNPYQPGESLMIWLIQQTYFYIAMAWQGIVTIIGLSVVHRIRWYWTIPGLLAGNAIFFGFLMLIHDHVALII